MKIRTNTLEIEIDVWSDPGDYPSNAGAGPLPDRKYVAGVSGELIIELTPDEFLEYLKCPEDFLGDLDVKNPPGVLSMKLVVDKVIVGAADTHVLEMHAEDVEGDPDYGADDGPEYDPMEAYERQQRREERYYD